eukprot:3432274-Pyramimonas_sp.AAC.1
MEFWKLPVGMGGMEGTEEDDDTLEQTSSHAEAQGYDDNDLEEVVDQDIEHIKHSPNIAKLRRAAPPAAAPSEFGRILLGGYAPALQRRRGPGAPTTQTKPDHFNNLSRASLAAIRLSNSAP